MNITHLNDLYTQLEYETDDKTIKQIKRQIKNIEKNMRCPLPDQFLNVMPVEKNGR